MTVNLLIGMGTYQRPRMLRKTLSALRNVQVPPGIVYLLIVDSAYSAGNVINEYRPLLPFELLYIGDQPRGIVQMRNAVLEKAMEKEVETVAFMDDDIMVSPDWILRMLGLMEQHGADVVDGAVRRQLPENTPLWIRKGKFFSWHSAPTGSIRKTASTSNVFFRIKLIKEWGLRFDPFFNFSGGEDTFFFTQACQKGAKMIWNNDKLACEQIPESKITLKWLLQRAYRRTNSKFYRKRKEYGYPKAAFFYTFNGIFQLAVGSILLIATGLFGPIAWTHSLRIITKGCGTFAGIFGQLYEEYRTVHGN